MDTFSIATPMLRSGMRIRMTNLNCLVPAICPSVSTMESMVDSDDAIASFVAESREVVLPARFRQRLAQNFRPTS